MSVLSQRLYQSDVVFPTCWVIAMSTNNTLKVETKDSSNWRPALSDMQRNIELFPLFMLTLSLILVQVRVGLYIMGFGWAR